MLTYLFIFSAAGIIILLSIKVYENTKEGQTFVMKKLSYFDAPIERRMQAGRRRYEQGMEKTSSFITEGIPKKTKEFISFAQNSAKEKYATMLPNIRGNRVLNKAGEVSGFLKDIAKHKEENGGGRIEEENINKEK